MTPLLSCSELLSRVPQGIVLPTGEDNEPDEARIDIAIRDATGVIVTHLPWLLNDDGEVAIPISPRFSDTVYGICTDLAVYRLTDAVTGSENSRNKYLDTVKLLEKIDREYQGGLSGPDLQAASIVEPNEEEGIPDERFFKKGGVY
jgi:phage gp36-like protein